MSLQIRTTRRGGRNGHPAFTCLSVVRWLQTTLVHVFAYAAPEAGGKDMIYAIVLGMPPSRIKPSRLHTQRATL
jgi:hypothetical protein